MEGAAFNGDAEPMLWFISRKARDMRGKAYGKRVVCPCASVADVMGLLGGGIRLELLTHVAITPRTVSDLVALTELAQPHVSHDLRLLHEHGLVEPNRVKKNCWYRLSGSVSVDVGAGVVQMRIRTSDGSEVAIRKKPESQAQPVLA